MTTTDGEQIQPETYLVKRTEHCPNSDFPVLVYRGVLGTGDELDEDEVSEKLQQYGWVKKVGHLDLLLIYLQLTRWLFCAGDLGNDHVETLPSQYSRMLR